MTTPAGAQMTLSYDGPALVANRMDVRQLAPALLASADAIHAASRLLYPEQSEPRVEIEATAPGSFEIHMFISDPTIWQRAVGLFTTPEMQAAGTFTGLLGFVIAGVGALVKIGKSRIRRAEPEGPNVRIELADGTILVIPAEAYRLIQDTPTRTAIREVVRPLRAEGVDRLDIRGATEGTRVERADVDAFDLPALTDQPIGEDTRSVALTLANVAFTTGNKWRLSDGESTFYATIEDTDFLNRVERNAESFARSDILRVQLRTEQWRTETGLRSEYTVLHVDEHIAGPREVPLPFADGES